MLLELRVKDLALVAAAAVRFGEGLNLLTGETGSGKSLIIDALGLSLGARASGDQVRHGARRALVESVFAADGGTVTLAREVGARGAARIDGRPATPGQLREIGRRLVGIHGQHEHTLLLDPEAQTLLLDAYAGALEKRDRVAAAHGLWLKASAEVEELERMRARGKREQEYLRWQLDELRAAGLRPGEEEALTAQRSVARHSARLTELTGQALEALRGDEGVSAAAAGVRSAADLDPNLQEVAGRLTVIEEELADAGAELRRYWEAIDSDPRRLEAVEERLAQLEGIKRKFGGTLEAAIAERDRLEAQLGVGEDLEGAIIAVGEAAARARGRLDEEAATLTRARESGGARLARAVAEELGGLRLEGAGFEVRLLARPAVTADGTETAEMMFSANSGEPLAPLARVASGGELARVMLAIRAVGAEAERLPTLIFDEVDAGIGGEAALQVGLRLKALGTGRQVLVVTHLAQIACFADHHLVVEKAPGPEGRNLVRVRELESPAERAAELARMMSGGVTEKALARAHELMEEAGAR